ncbi:hypothetical protein ACVWXM_009055 [Bradyrhizobium sp. GM7.3]
MPEITPSADSRASRGPDRISIFTAQMRSAFAMKSAPLEASRQAAVAIANTRPTCMTRHSAWKRLSEVSALSTASGASSPVLCTSRPRPHSVFSLKMGMRLRVSPS